MIVNLILCVYTPPLSLRRTGRFVECVHGSMAGRLRAASTLGLLVCCALCSPVRNALACDTTEACLREIETARSGVVTMTARFVQTKHLSLMTEPLVASGHFAFERPDRILWAIEKPRPVRIVVRGGEVIIPGLAAEDRRALESAPLAAVGRQLAALFAGPLENLQRDCELDARGDGKEIRLRLEPRRESWRDVFRSMEVRFRRPDLVIDRIRMEDALGDHLEIVLKDVQCNVELPSSTFESGRR